MFSMTRSSVAKTFSQLDNAVVSSREEDSYVIEKCIYYYTNPWCAETGAPILLDAMGSFLYSIECTGRRLSRGI